MDKRRLFLAIEIPPNIQKQLSKKLKSLKLKYVHFRPQQGWHITVKFLGLIEEHTIPTLIRDLEIKIIGLETFSLGLNEPGVFPHAKRAKHLWMGLTGDVTRLSTLAAKFADEGDKPFIPHMTVGTVLKAPTVHEKQVEVDKFLAMELKRPLWFETTEIILFRSKLTKINPIYTKIATYSLR